MVTDSGILYVVLVTLLFLPWGYGVVRFVMDTKNIYIPKGRQFLRGRRRLKEEEREEQEREERERQLY
ncbi:hypothetical protein SAMN04487950_1399 [Halogranum rubrum]|uniref:Uncharacterized protein n=2 Tax=Halogranum rubrum TaxID=553466 RepID=A0A1I4CWE4_9EURY|nr:MULTISPECIES: hypothetical protein [Halogranum]EJN59103.1 hypothetical protein HSB1_25240 [Halogranum salarium B-1]SFK84537.1 hypothetical protein SAMN04487950_1399 [Halogranum rubrum]